MRNLGGSVGIAMLDTFLTIREHFHFSIIGDRLTQNSVQVAQWTGHVSHLFGAKAPEPSVGHMRALAELQELVRREAYVMSYSQCFFIIGAALLLSVLALLLVPNPKSMNTPAA